MKVVHLRWSLNFGGLETMLVNIANEQARQGVPVTVIIINNAIAEELLNRFSARVEVIRIGRSARSKSFAFAKKLKMIINSIMPDIIHLHDASLYDFLPDFWRKNPQRICVTLHSMPYGKIGVDCRLGRIMQSFLFRKGGNVINTSRVGRVFSISHAVAVDLKKKYGVDSFVVCNGIHTNSFMQRALSRYDGEMKILQVGRLNHYSKGQDLLVEGVKKSIDKGVLCHLYFIGDGPSFAYLEMLVGHLGLTQYVSFLGSRSQDYLMNHLCDYDLFVQPSRREGFGLTVAEAMAACLPVVVSSGQGPAEVTENDRYGWVFNNGDTDSLAEQLVFLYHHYEDCFIKVLDAKKHVSEQYDVSTTAHNYLIAYNEMIRSDE